jgi:hypothetical protein
VVAVDQEVFVARELGAVQVLGYLAHGDEPGRAQAGDLVLEGLSDVDQDTVLGLGLEQCVHGFDG